jgi:hypothetical protein
LDYAGAVSCEYQLLVGEFFRVAQWPPDFLALAAGLELPPPDESFFTYAGMIAYRQAVAAAVGEIRPQLVENLLPVAGRHGLDALPWGVGWLIETAVVQAIGYGPKDNVTKVIIKPVKGNAPLPETSPVAPRQDPAEDALLLYLWLTGAYKDGIARHIVSPFLPLGFGDNPSRNEGQQLISGDLKLRAMRLKAQLAARRPRGRPPGRARWDKDEIYFVLANYIPTPARRRQNEPPQRAGLESLRLIR